MMWRDRTEAVLFAAMILCAIAQAVLTFWMLRGLRLPL